MREIGIKLFGPFFHETAWQSKEEKHNGKGIAFASDIMLVFFLFSKVVFQINWPKVLSCSVGMEPLLKYRQSETWLSVIHSNAQ